ncbi:Ubiquitin-like modifier-activating enzyme 6 [Lamellibrachia satsuma]|nr:Ubiquitin-like modifier-activating enzyme 6 [Lamellibrachia satsuma]
MATEIEIDDSLYSRQRYVLGDSAMQLMAKSNVLLMGLGGLGIEIAKNIVLAGVKSLTIHDVKLTSIQDVGTQFFLTDNDVAQSKNRAKASVPRLAELNPYVTVKACTESLDEGSKLDFLQDYQCVVVTEASLDLQLKVNLFCRSQQPPIKFVCADVYGVFCWAFSDFGATFEVIDATGEEPKQCFISHITKANPGVVSTLENRMHHLESGDMVTFKEVKGMTSINGMTCRVEVLTPYTFTVCDTSGADFAPHEGGGIATQVKLSQTVKFQSLEEQLIAPSYLNPDLGKPDAPASIHLGMCALHSFIKRHSRLPNVRCDTDASALVQIARQLNDTMMASKVDEVDETMLRRLSYSSQGCLPPLCAAIGGIVAQEVLKALTGKFSPLKQWIHLDATEVMLSEDPPDSKEFLPRGTRYDALRICIGEKLCQRLASLRLFMIGCGAIGCEMLKNYALMGVASSENGLISMTDHDLIEKSNLNRQFLFRPHHIRQPKSTTAALSTKELNPELRIDAHQNRVCPETESSLYTDAFFESQNVIVNALDNVEARRYVDSRCVTTQRALLESGTMGAKGHVQVIVPHLTESYGSQSDPPEEEVPYCTLKSFPSQIEHCIQWARDKFESSFSQKPSLHNKFWEINRSPENVTEKLEQGVPLEGVVQVLKLALCRPQCWCDCLVLGRLKFEKYFNHKAASLLCAFPLDTRLKDGSPFWQSPKRPPVPIVFDTSNKLHTDFVVACARLYAEISGITVRPQDLQLADITEVLTRVDVPEFRPSSKPIETDESVKNDKSNQSEEIDYDCDEMKSIADRINSLRKTVPQVFQKMAPLSFEKDDDENGHIDFITAASNLRAAMYGVAEADRLRTKMIAGRIVPAIATTTATVSGLVTIELIKVVMKAPLEHYKNCFLNLAIPTVIFSEPGPAEKTTLSKRACKEAANVFDSSEVSESSAECCLQAVKRTSKYPLGVCDTFIVFATENCRLLHEL